MTGCRHGAKNTLTTNYLALAEAAGARLHPLTTVTGVRPAGDGYEVETVRTGAWFARRTARRFTADQVIFAAGTYNTQKLLHTLIASTLPDISDRLGQLSRTNSESLLGVRIRHPRQDFTRGVAITSSWHPDEHTHIEPVRYDKGSNAMGLMNTVLTEGGPRHARWLAAAAIIRRPSRLRVMIPRHWSEQVIILLACRRSTIRSPCCAGAPGSGSRC